MRETMAEVTARPAEGPARETAIRTPGELGRIEPAMPRGAEFAALRPEPAVRSELPGRAEKSAKSEPIQPPPPPPDIAVRHAELVDETFNARYSARARLYAYRIRQMLPRGAYQRQYAWGLREHLDIRAMQAAGERLEGQHDFAAFGRSPRPGGHTVRNVHAIAVSAIDESVTIAVAADAFLYGMVRRIAGALVDVGRQRRSLDWIDGLLRGSSSGLRLAPAQGLVQVGVEY